MSDSIICVFCGMDKPAPCMNTRDMEMYAADGVPECIDALEGAGGGERSVDVAYVNRSNVPQNWGAMAALTLLSGLPRPGYSERIPKKKKITKAVLQRRAKQSAQKQARKTTRGK